MDNLNNCIITQYGPVGEFEGDSIPGFNIPSGDGQLELDIDG